MFEYAIEVLKAEIKELEHLISIWQWEDGEEDYCEVKEESISKLQSAIKLLEKEGKK